MRIDIITLFPGMFEGPFQESMLRRAQERGLLEIVLHQLRDYAQNRHRTVDDYPYGGGPGMILKPEPLFAAVEAICGPEEVPIVLLSPRGRLLTQRTARELAQQPRLILLCGHYEGVDERISERLATDEVSIGDYVLTGGELPAMVVVDAVVRCLPRVLGAEQGVQEDSLAQGLLEYPQYTRPARFRDWAVPEVLLSGNHAQIARWRREQALFRTWRTRPDLLAQAPLTEKERAWLERQGELAP